MAENNRVIGNRPLKINITIYELITLASILIELHKLILIIDEDDAAVRTDKNLNITPILI